MKIIYSMTVLMSLVLIACKCSATNAVSILDVESELVRLRGTCGLWREFLPMIDRVGAASEVQTEQDAYNLQMYTLTNILVRLKAATNDYVYDGYYDFVGARMCLEKINKWTVFQSSTNMLMAAADSLGELDVLPWEFGCNSNELNMAMAYATSKCSIAGVRSVETSDGFKMLCEKVRFRRLYNREVLEFRKSAFRYFLEVIKYRYVTESQIVRKQLWDVFLNRANATDEERARFAEEW